MSKQTVLPSPAPGGGAGGQRVGKKQVTTADFIAKAQAVHGVGTYDYSQAVYITAKTKVSIICPQHGLFEQSADGHTRGAGCPKCGNNKIGAALRKTTADFIAEAQAIHGVGTYDYSQVVYERGKLAVNILCPVHGLFKQQPNNHLYGAGCSKCGIDSIRLTASDFIAKAQAVHGVDTYDYSQAGYQDTKTKVAICCPTHGVFYQTPNTHLDGHGCAKCAQKRHSEGGGRTWAERADGKPVTLYFLRVFDGQEVFFKVGRTLNTVEQRFHSKRVLAAGYQYEVLALYQSTDANAIIQQELLIIKSFAHLSYRPRRSFQGETECFSSPDEILAIFPL